MPLTVNDTGHDYWLTVNDMKHDYWLSLLATRGTNIESHYKWHDARLLTLTVNDTRHDYWLSLLTYADLAIEENFYILDQLQNVHRHQYQVIGVMLL